jgi:hypothetical protein
LHIGINSDLLAFGSNEIVERSPQPFESLNSFPRFHHLPSLSLLTPPQWSPTCTDQFALANPGLWNVVVIALASAGFGALIAAIIYKRWGSFGACARACGTVRVILVWEYTARGEVGLGILVGIAGSVSCLYFAPRARF